MRITDLLKRRSLGRGAGRALLSPIWLIAICGALALLLVPSTAQAVTGFHTSASSVRVRAAATTNSAQLATIGTSGTAIDIRCQVMGQSITAAGFGTSAVWDFLNGYNGYISDLFVKETVYAAFDARLPRCGAATPPAATPAASGSSLTIRGLAGKCVDVRGGQTANGTAVQLYDCNATASQYWVWVGNPQNTLHAFGKCLDAAGGGTTNGTRIQLYDCNGTGSQTWKIVGAALVNPQSGRCLDVTGGNPASGTALQLYDCNGTAAQSWAPPTLRPWGATEPTNTGVAGQCTWGAKDQFHTATGVYPGIYGNAMAYADSARARGWAVVSTAEPRSIVVFGPGAQGAGAVGHVGWVESVETRSDGVYVSVLEMNFQAPYVWSRRVVKSVAGMSYILAPFV